MVQTDGSVQLEMKDVDDFCGRFAKSEVTVSPMSAGKVVWRGHVLANVEQEKVFVRFCMMLIKFCTCVHLQLRKERKKATELVCNEIIREAE